jgi:hypothetical protein
MGRPSGLGDLGRVGLVIRENREKIDNMKFHDFFSWVDHQVWAT